MHHDTLLPLELVQSGEWADVEEVQGEAQWVSRMAELGVRAGIRLQMLRQGNPCVLRVDGARFTFRGGACAQILVRPVAVAG